MQFADIFNTPVKAAYITFLGPLLGSIMRPFGGKLADRHGGALVTTITFASMIAGGGLIVAASVTSTLWLFIVAFVALFVLTGIGNGSIYKMIPTIFRSQAQAALVAAPGPMSVSSRSKRSASRSQCSSTCVRRTRTWWASDEPGERAGQVHDL